METVLHTLRVLEDVAWWRPNQKRILYQVQKSATEPLRSLSGWIIAGGSQQAAVPGVLDWEFQRRYSTEHRCTVSGVLPAASSPLISALTRSTTAEIVGYAEPAVTTTPQTVGATVK